jgi:hypothetical protein
MSKLREDQEPVKLGSVNGDYHQESVPKARKYLDPLGSRG